MKICWPEKTPNGNVAYIIGKAYDKKILWRNIKKKLSDVDRKKKDCFLSEVKKVCKQQKL